MKPYPDINGDSSVLSYMIGEDYIILKLMGIQHVFVYSYKKAGREHVEQMKVLAQLGDGLDKYVNENVKDLHD
ncbi:MAG: hypothetical protein JXN63_04590 [Candidatus Delongbacteria bacterium]|nr:hypothetical protein [Candidatus Delongbacteria bacterium]